MGLEENQEKGSMGVAKEVGRGHDIVLVHYRQFQ